MEVHTELAVFRDRQSKYSFCLTYISSMYEKSFSSNGSLCEKFPISGDSTVTHDSEVGSKKEKSVFLEFGLVSVVQISARSVHCRRSSRLRKKTDNHENKVSPPEGWGHKKHHGDG